MRFTNYEINFFSKGHSTKGSKIPFISNLRKPTCPYKQDVLEFATLRCVKLCFEQLIFNKFNLWSVSYLGEKTISAFVEFIRFSHGWVCSRLPKEHSFIIFSGWCARNFNSSLNFYWYFNYVSTFLTIFDQLSNLVSIFTINRLYLLS